MKNQIIKIALKMVASVAVLAVITQTASAQFQFAVPDAGTSSALLGMACASLLAARRFKR